MPDISSVSIHQSTPRTTTSWPGELPNEENFLSWVLALEERGIAISFTAVRTGSGGNGTLTYTLSSRGGSRQRFLRAWGKLANKKEIAAALRVAIQQAKRSRRLPKVIDLRGTMQQHATQQDRAAKREAQQRLAAVQKHMPAQAPSTQSVTERLYTQLKALGHQRATQPITLKVKIRTSAGTMSLSKPIPIQDIAKNTLSFVKFKRYTSGYSKQTKQRMLTVAQNAAKGSLPATALTFDDHLAKHSPQVRIARVNSPPPPPASYQSAWGPPIHNQSANPSTKRSLWDPVSAAVRADTNQYLAEKFESLPKITYRQVAKEMVVGWYHKLTNLFSRSSEAEAKPQEEPPANQDSASAPSRAQRREQPRRDPSNPIGKMREMVDRVHETFEEQ